MKHLIRSKPRHVAAGSVLLATICTTAVIAVALMGYMHMSTQQQRVTARSQVWNTCMPVAEAGVEEALTHCFLNSSNLASEGWQLDSTRTNYFKTNSLPEGYYHVQFSTNIPHVITSVGYSRLPTTTNYISRSLRVVSHQDVVFDRAIKARGQVDFNGNNVKTDSYDSRDPAKSSGKGYDPNKAGDKGDIVTRSLANIGNADIWGHLYTPPLSTVAVGPNASVGSAKWHLTGKLGVEPGWLLTEPSPEVYPKVKAPFTSGRIPLSGSQAGQAYDVVFGDGNYAVASLSGKALVNGKAVVYVSGSVLMIGPSDGIHIRNNASLKLYVRGNVDIKTIINPNNYAGSCAFYGLPTCTDFRIGGGGNLSAVIYAPDAHVRLQGGTQVSGAVVANDFTMGGNSQFHYDEALGVDSELMLYELQGWDEL